MVQEGAVDVVIVGAGSAGAAAAYHCARLGLSVICLDRRPLGSAGARWVNGVPLWTFDEAKIPRPGPEERHDGEAPFHLVAGEGGDGPRVILEGHGVVGVDMRQLVGRLQRSARRAGAELLGEIEVLEHEGASVQTTAGPIEARWLVDASGLHGARLLGQPRVAAEDLCTACQQVFSLADEAGARAFFREHGARLGHTLCFTGVAGGYSVLNVRVEGGQVSVLTGSIPSDGCASGYRLLFDFVEAQPWIGPRRFGGSRAIPLRRPYDRLADGTVALLGDAACQVSTAHGSGIGVGLIAARMLAEALAEGRGPRGYAVNWQRWYGGFLSGQVVFRRLTQGLSAQDVAALMESGLLDQASALESLRQRRPRLSWRQLPGKLLGLWRQRRRLRRRLSWTVAQIVALEQLYDRFPRDPQDWSAFGTRVERIMQYGA